MNNLKAKIIPRISGGIGNQLFMYAAARQIGHNSGAELRIDNWSGFYRDFSYKRSYQLHHFKVSGSIATPREMLKPFSRLSRALMRTYNRLLPFANRSYIVQEGLDYDERLLQLRPVGTLYLEGYWQSEKYFKDIEKIIREELEIIPPTDKPNIDMRELIDSKLSVAIHYRFFDSPTVDDNNNASFEYYDRAIKYLDDQLGRPHYFIFSDKPDLVRVESSIDSDRYTFVTHNQIIGMEYADLWLMSSCKHFIIANSTFSWWAAWLSKNADKKVIAPGFVKRQGAMCWGFEGLLPDEWVKL